MLTLVTATGCARHTLPVNPAGVTGHSPVVGDAAPEIALPSLDGAAYRLSSYAGQVVVVTFWATFCGPCREELPVLDALRARHPDVVVLAVSLDDADSDDAVRGEVKQLQLHFPVLRDPDGRAAFQYMRYAATPLTVVIGRDQRLRALNRGYTLGTAARLEQEVATAVSDVPAP